MRDRVRVAAVQFATGTGLDENLAVCLRMLDAAAAEGAELAVLPEFCNHISVYEDRAHCRAVAVPLDGAWMGSLARRVARHGMYAALAVTVPRTDRGVTLTSVLLGPGGEIVATADKQTLMGNERVFLCAGEGPNPVADTAFGRVGMYACMDGVTFETSRTFAVRGARLLLNSLNSFARDEAALHVPVRAAENGVFAVAANKVGPLLPADRVVEFSQALGVPAEALEGAGESQIVAPDGTVVAKGPETGEAVAVDCVYGAGVSRPHPVVVEVVVEDDHVAFPVVADLPLLGPGHGEVDEDRQRDAAPVQHVLLLKARPDL